jgi:hypothetical protein
LPCSVYHFPQCLCQEFLVSNMSNNCTRILIGFFLNSFNSLWC